MINTIDSLMGWSLEILTESLSRCRIDAVFNKNLRTGHQTLNKFIVNMVLHMPIVIMY